MNKCSVLLPYMLVMKMCYFVEKNYTVRYPCFICFVSLLMKIFANQTTMLSVTIALPLVSCVCAHNLLLLRNNDLYLFAMEGLRTGVG